MPVPAEFREPTYHPDRKKLPSRLLIATLFALAGLGLIGAGMPIQGLVVEVGAITFAGLSV